MKFSILVSLVALPAASLAQTSPPPTQADSAAARVVASRSVGDSVSESGSAARATATAAIATRTTAPPVLDGKTDDEAWKNAQVIDKFLEYEPNEGAETRFKTEIRVTYDEKYLYILGRMFDPAPDSIVSLLSRRDIRTASEQLKIMIDSYYDRRTGFEFAVNPAGVKRDYYVSDDNNEDPTWDGVWDVATLVDSVGWVAEFRIPFSQLRFNNKPEMTFGFMVVRDIGRTSARTSWPLYYRGKQGYFSQLGDLSGIRDLDSPRRLEVTPYVVTKNVTRPDGLTFRHPQEFSAGADVKYGLSSSLTLDATINPDFGQVEADPSVLNLSAFEQFFEERRPFFLEGAGIFKFRTACGDIDSGCTGLFYSRRIGRSPQLGGLYGDQNSATNTTILGAAKVGGRLGRGLSVGLLDAITQREVGAADATIEPRTNYAVARLQQSMSGGGGDVGLMVTAVNRDLDELTSPVLRSGAYAAGLDLRKRFLRNYELTSYVAGSLVRGSAEAIASTQRDGVHRYQRSDDGIELDPTRTSLTGDAQRLTVSKFGGGITRFQSVYQRFSPGFETNDVGFQARADEQMFRNWFALQFNNPNKAFRRGFFNSNTMQTWTSEGLPTNMSINTNWHVQFRNQWWGHIGGTLANFAGSTYADRDARGGPAVRRDRSYDVWTGIELDSRKAYTPFLFLGAFGGDEGRSRGHWFDPSVQFRISSRFSGSLGAYYEKNINDNQWHTNFGVSGVDTTHYTFARLDQSTLSLTTRMNFTASPTLSLQFYAQPFMSAGTYSDWRELANPRAENYEDRYQPYAGGDPGGFDFKQLRSNTVVRWEYRPGSTLFFVWTQGRERALDQARRFDIAHDLRDMLRLHPDNTLLVKASYWFNP